MLVVGVFLFNPVFVTGQDSPLIAKADSLNQLGKTLKDAKNYEQAEMVFRQAKAIYEEEKEWGKELCSGEGAGVKSCVEKVLALG